MQEEFKVSLVDIAKIKPFADNPKKRDHKAITVIARSIEENGWQQPIVVDDGFVIIAGHGRYEAAKLLGIDKVPVKVAYGLSEAQCREYRIMDNKSNEGAEWDNALLFKELSALEAIGRDIEYTGFDTNDLSFFKIDILAMPLQDAPTRTRSDGLKSQPAKAAAVEPVAEAEAPMREIPASLSDDIVAVSKQHEEEEAPALSSEYAPFSLNMPVEQRDEVYRALGKAKELYGVRTQAEALFAICEAFNAGEE